ncbi:MAG: hypothetical protein ACLSCQ_10340 [Evtepia gabavorous]
MGGDNAPQAIVRGALDANRDHGRGDSFWWAGRRRCWGLPGQACGQKSLPAGVEIKDAKPGHWRSRTTPPWPSSDKPDSSLTVGLNLLKDGAGDAFVSAGSTGALLSGGHPAGQAHPGHPPGGPGPQWCPLPGERAVLMRLRRQPPSAPRSTCSSSPIWALTTPGGFWASRTPGWAC